MSLNDKLLPDGRKEFFCVTSVSRDDIKCQFDEKYHKAIDMIADGEMEWFASKLGDCLMSGGGYYMFIEERGKELFMEYYIQEAVENAPNPNNYPKDCPHQEEYDNVWSKKFGTGQVAGCGLCPDKDICKTEGGWCDYWDEINPDE